MTILEAAAEFGVDTKWAVRTRLAYLRPKIFVLEKEIKAVDKRIERMAGKQNVYSVMRTGRAEQERVELQKELRPLKAELLQLQRHLSGKPEHADAITPARIETARNFPIEQLLDQKPRGAGCVVCCPFHQDTAPSASIKFNVLICFGGCLPNNGAKGWDSIALLMERDGFSFGDAVRQLS